MIVEALYAVWANVCGWALGLMPAFNPTGVVSGVGAILGPLSVGINELGAWLPWASIGIIVPISIGLYVAGLVFRAVKSFIPTISG